MDALLKERNHIFATALLILLTLMIGLVGIYKIHGLNSRIEDLGSHHLKLEGAVLGMRVHNANYAMEIRSFLFWAAEPKGLTPLVTDYSAGVREAEKNLRRDLDTYLQNARLEEQKQWGTQIAQELEDLFARGSKLITKSEKETAPESRELRQDRLMLFEKRVYEVDQFLNHPMGSSNLEAIQRQIALAKSDKENAVSFLGLSLVCAILLGSFIGMSAYFRMFRARVNRQHMLNRMMDVEETERRKLSTAVHDEMGQDLSALQIRLGLISQQMTGEESVKTHVEECRKITGSLIKKSHNIAFLLRPPDLDEVGLIESIEALLLESKHMTGISYDYGKPENFTALSPEYSLLFYRISQELLTNMAKHAKAKRVRLEIAQKSRIIELSYADDGQGFDYSEILKHPARRHEDKMRLGLLGLKERVELLEGTMSIQSGSGKGTSVLVQLPV